MEVLSQARQTLPDRSCPLRVWFQAAPGKGYIRQPSCRLQTKRYIVSPRAYALVKQGAEKRRQVHNRMDVSYYEGCRVQRSGGRFFRIGQGDSYKMKLFFGIVFLLIAGCASEKRSVESVPDAGIVRLHNRAVALMGHYDCDSAIAVLDSVRQALPGNRDVMVNLAIAHFNRQKTRDMERTRELLDSVLVRDSAAVRARYLLGLLLLYQGQPGDAFSHFAFTARHDSSDADSRYYMGQCLLELGRHEEAAAVLKRAVEEDPFLRSAYYSLFMAYRHLDSTERASEMMEQFRGLANNPRGRVLQFKYTRMGGKAEVKVIDAGDRAAYPRPDGALFDGVAPLCPGGDSVSWVEGAGRRSFTACDINGDAVPDLVLTGSVLISGAVGNAVFLSSGTTGSFRLDTRHALAAIAHVNTCLWGDFDNDSLTDVYLCRDGPNMLMRRDTSGAWLDVTDETGTGGDSSVTVDGALLDADHDGDLDIFVVNADGENELLNNNRDGTFRPLAGTNPDLDFGSSSRSVIAADIDDDRDADIVVINRRGPHAVFENHRLWNYTESAGTAFAGADIRAAVAGDLDADGRVEIYTVDSTAVLTRWSLHSNDAWIPTRFENVRIPGADAGGVPPMLAIGDIDLDGTVELTGFGGGGYVVAAITAERCSVRARWVDADSGGAYAAWTPLMRNVAEGIEFVGWKPGVAPVIHTAGPGRFACAGILLSGMHSRGMSMRSNASGIGARVAARVDSRWTMLHTFSRTSGPGQSLQPLCFGLGGSPRIDFAAVDWPDGVFQTEIGLQGGTLHAITETQRQMSSCPVVFVHDGKRNRFVSDILGVGGIGYALAPGVYGTPRPWEYLLLPAGLPVGDSTVDVLVAEPMEELSYIDHCALKAFELPPGWSMTLDERMGTGDPPVGGKPVFFRRTVKPAEARDAEGTDITATLHAGDFIAPDPGTIDTRFVGYLAREQVLTLHFAEALDSSGDRPVLHAFGWVEYPYSQTNFAASQAGVSCNAPTVEARGGDGAWHVVLDRFGYPAGMPKEMSAPLEGLPAGTRSLRIRTNQEIYWDYIAVVFAEPCPDARAVRLPLLWSELRRTGYPERIHRPQRRPDYDFSRRAPLWDCRVPEGFYTRFGPVDSLLRRRDDATAILGPGEGIAMRFSLPDDGPPERWTRRYVLEAYGWCKDMDLYTRDGETVEPVPKRARLTRGARKLITTYNTRFRSGRE